MKDVDKQTVSSVLNSAVDEVAERAEYVTMHASADLALRTTSLIAHHRVDATSTADRPVCAGTATVF